MSTTAPPLSPCGEVFGTTGGMARDASLDALDASQLAEIVTEPPVAEHWTSKLVTQAV